MRALQHVAAIAERRRAVARGRFMYTVAGARRMLRALQAARRAYREEAP